MGSVYWDDKPFYEFFKLCFQKMTDAAATALCAEINEALAACVAANVSQKHKNMTEISKIYFQTEAGCADLTNQLQECLVKNS